MGKFISAMVAIEKSKNIERIKDALKVLREEGVINKLEINLEEQWGHYYLTFQYLDITY